MNGFLSTSQLLSKDRGDNLGMSYNVLHDFGRVNSRKKRADRAVNAPCPRPWTKVCTPVRDVDSQSPTVYIRAYIRSCCTSLSDFTHIETSPALGIASTWCSGLRDKEGSVPC